MGRRRGARSHHYARYEYRRITTPATEAGPAAPATDEKAMCLTDLPRTVLEEIMLLLPLDTALSFGSTCYTLHQHLTALRPNLISQCLNSKELLPETEEKNVKSLAMEFLGDFLPEDTLLKHVHIHLHWTPQASRLIYHLAVHEKVPAELLWGTVVPRLADVPKGSCVRCFLGCMDWVRGSLYKRDNHLCLYDHLAKSDLTRLKSHFESFRKPLVADGVRGESIAVILCTTDSDMQKKASQRNAALRIHWVNNAFRTRNVDACERMGYI